tara:strand:- start:382 stop:1092 length:711 start_codon:yes stop_codon:yes gene_type:complete
MVGRQTRRNCPFCQHPSRDAFEQSVQNGLVDVVDLDRQQDWQEGTAHRHMRRHSGNYHNNSNSDCPLCTHPERANIEASILNHIIGIDEMAEELDMASSALSHHMEMHTQPIIQRQAAIEAIPNAITSVTDAIRQTDNNLQRLNGLFNDHLNLMEAERMESGMLDYKGLDVAVKLHREVRDTLGDLAKHLSTAESVETSQQVNVLTVIQAHFSEKSPEEWRVLRKALAEAGVLGDE